VHHVGARALRGSKDGRENSIFFAIFTIAMGGGAFFSRATVCTPKWCAPIDSPDQQDTF